MGRYFNYFAVSFKRSQNELDSKKHGQSVTLATRSHDDQDWDSYNPRCLQAPKSQDAISLRAFGEQARDPSIEITMDVLEELMDASQAEIEGMLAPCVLSFLCSCSD